MEENPGMAHKIVLNNRNQGNLTGILDVISFDENTIVLDTDMGLLTIKGKDLHVNRLSLEKGEIDIEGRTVPPVKIAISFNISFLLSP